MTLLRTAILLLLTLLVIDGFVGTASAASATSKAEGVTCAQSFKYDDIVQAVQSTADDDASEEADCYSGHCRGASCHCSCHGVVSGLPAAFTSVLSLTTTANYPGPFPGVTSRHPSPPVRPPRT